MRDSNWLSNRRWAIAYKCSRCGAIAFDFFDPEDGSEGNLQCTALPDGWANHGVASILCPTCAESYREWYSKGGLNVSQSKEASSD